MEDENKQVLIIWFEIRPRESPSSRSYPRGCVRLAGSPPCSLLELPFPTCSSCFASCLLDADLISISRCSSPRGFARVVVSRCSFPYTKRKEMTAKSLHPLCAPFRRLETRLLPLQYIIGYFYFVKFITLALLKCIRLHNLMMKRLYLFIYCIVFEIIISLSFAFIL